MKKILFTLIAVCALTHVANAQMGGFKGPAANSSVKTVQEALTLRDDTPVILQGNIVNSLGDEKYTFKDSTGEIMVEIDNEDWRGVDVTPNDTVEISGEVDKEMFEATKIDVKSVRIVQ